MSENKIEDNIENDENKSASLDDNYTQNIQTSRISDLFKKIFNRDKTPAIDGERPMKIKKTSMSLDTFYMISDIRENIVNALKNVSTSISNFMKPKNTEITNGMKTIEFGKDGARIIKEADGKNSNNAERADTDKPDVNNIIIIIGQDKTKNIVVEDFTVDEKGLKETEKQSVKKSIQDKETPSTTITGMESGEILTDERTNEDKEEEPQR